MSLSKTKSLLKIGEAAKALGVSIDTLRRWERAGKIEATRTPGGTRLYSLSQLKKVNPASVADFQAKSLTTEELLKRAAEETDNVILSDSEGSLDFESLDSSVTSLPQNDNLKQSFVNKFLIGTGILSAVTLAITSWIAASYLTQPKATQEFFKNNVASGLLAPFNKLAEETVAVISPQKAQELGFIPQYIEPPPINDKLLTINDSPNVLAVTTSPQFLEINTDTQINGSLFVRDQINNLSLEGTPSASTITLSSGETVLTVSNDATLDQDVSTTSTPAFNTLNLSATSNQLVFQSGGPSGTLTWTPTAARIITLPDATTTLMGKDTTDTLTNKSISGSSNTLTNIPNSALVNSKVTVTAGTNLSGGGDVTLGSSVTLSLKTSPAISGVLSLADGTAAAPSLTFTDDADTGLYRIGSNRIGLITGGSATSGITIDGSGNLGIGNITPSSTLYVSGNVGIGYTGSSVAVPGLGLAVAGRVGIGTTSPGASLDVIGTGRFSSTLSLSDGTAATPALNFINDTDTGLWRIGANQLALTTGGGAVSGLNINSSGNVGIGTTNQSTSLDIQGTIDRANLRLSSDPTGDVVGLIEAYGPGDWLSIRETGGKGLYLQNQASAGPTIINPSGGNIGIGTVSPTDKLIVTGGNVGIGISSPLSTLAVNGNSTIGWGLTGVAGPSNGLAVFGNVGIGVTSPAGQLDVSNSFYTDTGRIFIRATDATDEGGQIDLAASSPTYNNTISVDSYQGRLRFFSNSPAKVISMSFGTTPELALEADGPSLSGKISGFGVIEGAGETDLTLQTVTSGNILLKPVGNVGIGTSAAGAALQVNGGGLFGWGTASVAGPSNGLGVFGNVGIGTTTANSNLSVAGNAHIGSLYQGTAAPANGLFVDGNVGIGATTSSNKLDVWGNSRITGTLTVDGALTSGSTTMPSLTLTGNNAALSFTGTTPSLTSGSSAFGLFAGGNVGIGTTTTGSFPSALTIRGAANGPDDELIAFQNNGGTTKFHWNLYRTGGLNLAETGVADGRLFIAIGGNVGIGDSGSTSPPAKLFVNQTSAGDAFRVEDANADTSPFVVNLDGNVGIANSAPSYTLDVIGTTRISSTAVFNGAFTLGDNGDTGSIDTSDWDISTTGAMTGIGAITADGVLTLSANNAALSFTGTTPSLTSGSSVFGLFAGGNVGIGTTGNVYGGLTVRGAGTGTGITFQTYGSGLGQGLTVLDNGNVGIGTTGPGALAHLSSTAAQDLFRVDDNGAGDTSPFVINLDGNVGIANSAPSYTLDVVGTSRVSSTAIFNGNVGIGTATPAVQLDISAAAVRVAGTLPSAQAQQMMQLGSTYPDRTGNTYGLLMNPTIGSVTGVFYANFYSSPTVAANKTVATAYGLYIDTPTINSGGAITTNYGLRIDTQKPTGVTTSYGIYQTSTNDQNYFAGNVGIGFSSPTSLLQVSSTASQNLFRVDDNGAGDTSPFIINLDGNVGIANSAPSYVLDVIGSTRFSTNITQGGGQFLAPNGTASLPAYSFTNSTSTGMYSPSVNALALNTNGASTPPLTITAGGNIGIGITSPGAALELTGNLLFTKEAARTISVATSTSTNTAGGALTVQSGTGVGTGVGGALNLTAGSGGSGGANGGAIVLTSGSNGGTGSTGAINLTVSSGSGSEIQGGAIALTAGDSTGSNRTGGTISLTTGYGAQNTGAGGAFSVTTGRGGGDAGGAAGNGGAITLTTGAAGSGNNTNTPISGAISLITGTGQGTNPADTGNITLRTGAAISTGTAGTILFQTNGTTTRMAVNGGGNVGVGTSVPGALFVVTGGNVGIGTSAAGAALQVNGGGLFGWGTASVAGPSNGLGVFGNVGIGTTTANSNLSVAGNAHIGSLYQGTAAPANGLFVDGNVGIGATTSSNKLDVWGNSRITGTLTVDGALTSGSTTMPSLTLTGNNAALSFTGTTPSLTSGSSVFGLFAGGNVGIGTTGNVYGGLTVRGAGTGTNITLQTYGSNLTQGLTVLDNGNVGIGTTGPGALAHLSSTASQDLFRVDDNGAGDTSPFVIALDGNVGIANSAPSYTLDVVGTGRISSLLNVLGNVGIGTVSPNRAGLGSAARVLTIEGQSSSNAGALEILGPSAGTGNEIGRIYFGRTAGTGPGGSVTGAALIWAESLDGNDDTGLVFSTSNAGTLARRMSINNAGNVGIANSAPSYTLDVIGSTRFSTNITQGAGQFLAADGTASLPAYSFSADTNTGLFRAGTDALDFVTGGTERLTITAGGNVGIGITAPGQMLHLFNRNADVAISFLGNETNTAITENSRIVGAGDAGTGGMLQFFTKLSGGAMGTDPRMVIDNAGNVGIGFTSPTSLLQVSSTASQNLFRVDDNGTGDTSPFVINLDGNVGIANSAPSYTLDVVGTTRISSTAIFNGAFTLGDNGETGEINTSDWDISTTGAMTGIGAITADGVLTLSANNAALSFTGTTPSLTSGSSVFGLFAGGNVGIGTTGNVYGGLTVRGAGTGTGITFQTYGSGLGQGLTVLDNGNVGIGNTSASQIFQINPSGTSAFVVNSSGNVGIGFTSPTAKLEILSTTTPQLRVAYDTSNYMTTAVSSTGVVTLDTNGTGSAFSMTDPLTISPTATTLTTSLESYWKMDENSGTRADSVGSNTLSNNGTTTSNPGKIGNAGQFTDAESDYLSIDDNASLSTGNIDFTVSAWVYFDARGVDYIVSKSNGSNNGEYFLWLWNGGDAFRFSIWDGTTIKNATDTTAISNGAWYFVVGWHDAGADTINIQVNNGTVNSTATAGTAPSDTNIGFTIGSTSAGALRMDGRIDGVGFWKKVLTPAEKTELYNGGTGLDHPFKTALNLNGDLARTIQMQRHTTSNTAGNSLTLLSGGATAAATDKNGGNLILQSGVSTGTGTSQIQFWTVPAGSTGTTDNLATQKMVIDGAGNVGINNASPIQQFQVNSTTSSFVVTSTGNAGIGYTTPTANLHVLNTAAQDSFRVDDVANDTSPFIINLDGNVGIANSAPSYALDVIGATRFSTNITQGAGQFLAADGTASLPAYSFSADTDNGMFRPSTDALGFATGGSSRMTITAAGNVGIGITAPSGVFQVGSSATAPVLFASSLTGNVGIKDASPAYLLTVGSGDLFGVNSSGYALLPNGAAATPSLTFTGDTDTGLFTAGSDILGFASGGVEVARFTGRYNNTSAVFEVNGTAAKELTTAGGTLMAKIAGNYTTLANGTFSGNVYWASITPGDMYSAGTTTIPNTATLYIATAMSPRPEVTITNNYALWVDAGQSRFDGNVGIGTTNAIQRLQINETTSNPFVVTSGGNVGIGYTTPTANLHVLNTAAQDSFRVDDVANDTSPFVIDQAGNVGIANSAPSYALDVVGTLRSSGQTILAASSGNVGIGTAAPAELLEVSGGKIQITRTGNANLLELSVNTGGEVFAFSNTGDNLSLSDDTATLVTFDSANNAIQFVGGGNVYINDTANTGMTLGLTINQGTNTNEILALKGSDIAHGVTGVAETDTYAFLSKLGGDNGGLKILGIRDTAVANQAALQIEGIGPGNNTTKTSGGRAYVELVANNFSGTARANPGSNSNLFAVGYGTDPTLVSLIDFEGELHLIPTSGINTLISPVGTSYLMGGNVGIGTSGPVQKFQINENSGVQPVVITSAGNVGIGATSPGAQLQVQNGTAWSRLNAGDSTFTTSSSRTIKENFNLVSGSGILDKIQNVPVYTFDFIDGPTDIMGLVAEDFYTIFGRGDSRSINYQEVAMASWLGIQELNNRTQSLQSQLYVSGSGNVGIGTTSPSAAFQVNTNTSNPFVVQSGGNVGIGTTAPGAKLHVAGNLNLGGSMVDGSLSDDVQWLTVSGDTANQAVGLRVRQINNTASPRLIAGTYVEAPDGAGGYFNGSMHIYGSNYGVPEFRGYTNVSSDAGNGLILRSINPVATSAVVRIFAGSTGGFADERVTVLGSGNVGIGVASPTSKLHIKDNVNGNLQLLIENTSTGASAAPILRLVNDAGTIGMFALRGSGQAKLPNYLDIDNEGSAGIVFRTAGTSKMLLDTSGNLGIGFTSPNNLFTVGATNQFQVNSSGAIAAVTGITTSGGYTQTGSSDNTLSGALTLSANNAVLSFTGSTPSLTSGSSVFGLFAGGNVGIGTTGNVYGGLTVRGAGTSNGITFQTYGSGLGQGLTVLDSGNVGIGTTNPLVKLDVAGNARISGNLDLGAATIASSAGNLAIQFTSDTVGSVPTQFIIKNSLGQGLFSVDASGSARLAGTLTTEAGAFDVAEDYEVADNTIEAGDVVAISPVIASETKQSQTEIATSPSAPRDDNSRIVKSATPYDNKVIGIISTKAALRLSNKNTSGGPARSADGSLNDSQGSPEVGIRPVALAGRVPVKVSLENGPIEKGDYLTSSSTPGVAMKALRPGPTVGKALEAFPADTSEVGFDSSEVELGKILTFVNVSFADPGNFLASLSMDSQGNLIIPKIRAGSIILDSSVASASASLTAGDGQLSLSTDPNYTSAGPNLASNSNQYIDLGGEIASLEYRIATLEASSQKQTAQIKNLQDILGNVGIATSSAQVAEATPASEIASPSSQLVNQSTNQLNLTPPDILLNTGSAVLTNLTVKSEATISGQLTAYNLNVSASLKSLGTTSLGNTIIAGDLTVDGTLSIENGSEINVIGSQGQTLSTQGLTLTSGILYLQKSSLAQGVDIFNGKVTIDKDGVLKAQTLLADQIKINEGKTVGVGKILAGQIEVSIENPYVEDNSLILVTPNAPLLQTLGVVERKAKTETASAFFKVKLAAPETQDINFDYLIIGVNRQTPVPISQTSSGGT